jgi:Matrixin
MTLTLRPRLVTLLVAALAAAVPASVLAPGLTPTARAAATSTAGGRGSAASYTLHYSGGKVIRWNSCRTIHYRVNVAHAPKGALADVRTAVGRVASATGLKFFYDGATSAIPQSSYGTSLNPTTAVPRIVIAWAAPGKGAGHSNLLSSDSREIGVGGYRAYSWRRGSAVHRLRILAGFVVISTKSNALKGGFGPGPDRGGLLLHELGHAVGLGHTQDKTQIMYPVLGPYASYGAGDRTGLHKVGSAAGCIA